MHFFGNFRVVGAECYCAKGVSFHPKNMFTMDPSANELMPDKTVDVMVSYMSNARCSHVRQDMKGRK